MNLYRMALRSILLAALASLAKATEPTSFVSQTFHELQARVISRDAQSGAILSVRAKSDAPPLGFGLDFSLEVSPDSPETAVVVLSRSLKAGDGAMRQELQNQRVLKELAAERLVREAAKQKKMIHEISEGKLAAGMSVEEVLRIKGPPQRADYAQAALGATALVYPDMILLFQAFELTRI